MDIISPHDYLNALASLTKRVAAKKYMFVGKASELPKLSQLESEINIDIKNDIGYGINEITNPDDIIKYETRVDFEFSKVTNQKIIKYPVDDEIELFKIAKRASSDYLKNFELEIGGDRKEFLKKLKLTVPRVISTIRTANQAFIIPDTERKIGENILLMSNIKYLNKDCNAFIHLHHGTQKDNVLTVGSFIIAQERNTKNFNPIRFFLNVLNWYGVVLKVNNKTKRFFLDEKVISKRLDGDINIFEIVENIKKSSFYVSSSIKKMHLYVHIKFAYGINETRYFQNLFDGRI